MKRPDGPGGFLSSKAAACAHTAVQAWTFCCAPLCEPNVSLLKKTKNKAELKISCLFQRWCITAPGCPEMTIEISLNHLVINIKMKVRQIHRMKWSKIIHKDLLLSLNQTFTFLFAQEQSAAS